MSGSSSVTVTGSNPNSPVTVSSGTGDILHLAAQLGALLNSIQGSGHLVVSSGSADSLPSVPGVPSGTFAELLVTDGAGPATIPSGYSYVVDVSPTQDTLTGSNLALITGTTGGSYFVTGTSTVAASGGDNLIAGSGTYVLAASSGNDSIVASGIGTIAAGTGSNLISAAGINIVESTGQDTVVAGMGLTTVDASGSNAFIFGSSSGQSLLAISITGSQATVSATGSDTTITLAGSQGLVLGGQAGAGTMSVQDAGSNDTIAGLSSPTTVTAGVGSSGLFVFGGTGGLTFVGGDTAATVLGSSTANSIVGGSGGVLYANEGNDTVTGSPPGGATIFGTDGHGLTYLGSGNLLYAAGAGSETLNAVGSSGTNDLFAVGAGNVSIAGGSGTNLYDAGAGSDTFIGGSGSNDYFFLAANTAGSQDFVTNLSSTDSVGLIGYDSTMSSTSVSNGSTTLTLSDNTKITFVNVTNITNNIHYG